MDDLDEIKQQLKEINESLQSHRKEWKSAIGESKAQYKEAISQQQSAYRKRKLFWIILLIIILSSFYWPYLTNLLFRFRQSDPENDLLMHYIGYSADTQPFDGNYEIDPECLKAMIANLPGSEQDGDDAKAMLEMLGKLYSNMILKDGVMRCGKILVQEFRMRGDTNEQGEFVGGALWHEDIHDPGDACIVNVKLKMENEKLYFYYTPLGESFDQPIVFKKR